MNTVILFIVSIFSIFEIALCFKVSVNKGNEETSDGLYSKQYYMNKIANLKYLQRNWKNDERNKLKYDNPDQYRLFTKKNPDIPEILFINSRVVTYDPSKPLHVIVHGWQSAPYKKNILNVKDAHLYADDCNVIILDWRKEADSSLFGYMAAAGDTIGEGEDLAHFLEWLIETKGGNWNKVHLVGHSLGAHVVGSAGRTLKEKGILIRITGLDPARPRFEDFYIPFLCPQVKSISHEDGSYVEIIHTNAQGLGIYNPVGHVDFYPNGGKAQPGCSTFESMFDYIVLEKLFHESTHNKPVSSHSRAVDLYAASVKLKNKFFGFRCDSLEQAIHEGCHGETFVFGSDDFTKKGSGIYGLKTRDSYPFYEIENSVQ